MNQLIIKVSHCYVEYG